MGLHFNQEAKETPTDLSDHKWTNDTELSGRVLLQAQQNIPLPNLIDLLIIASIYLYWQDFG